MRSTRARSSRAQSMLTPPVTPVHQRKLDQPARAQASLGVAPTGEARAGRSAVAVGSNGRDSSGEVHPGGEDDAGRQAALVERRRTRDAACFGGG